MKKLLTTLLFSVVTFVTAAQSEQPSQLGIGAKTIGTNHDSGRDIVAREYLMDRNIYSAFVDSVTHSATVVGRDSRRNGSWSHMGSMTIFDLSNDHARWGRSMDNKQTQIIQMDDILVRSWSISNKSYGHDMEGGNILWENDILFYYADLQAKIGLGYKFANFIKQDQNTLFGVDLTTGKILWRRELSRKSGWSGISRSGDTILIVSGGLHSVDMNTGQGWSTPFITGQSGYKGAVVEELDNTVTMDFETNYKIGAPRDYTSSLASNILSDGSRHYCAGQNKVVCVDDSGSLVWEHAFADNAFAGSSELFLRGGKLYMVNKGYGIRGATKVNYGLSFFVCFDAVSGNLLFRSELGSSVGIVEKLMVDNNNFLYLTSASMVAKYSLESGTRVSDKVMPGGKTFSQAFEFTNKTESLFLLKEGIYEPFVPASGVAFYSPVKGLISLGEDLGVTDEISSESVFRQLFSYQGYRLVYGNGTGVLISNEGKVIAQIEMTDSAFIKDGALYFTDRNRLYRVEMAQIIN